MRPILRTGAALLLLILFVAAFFYYDPLWFRDASVRLTLWRAGVRSDYIQAGHYRLHYFEALPPDGSPGTPLVLVHGLGARGEDWAPMIPALARGGFHVYVPDLLGFGRSPKPDVPYSIALEEQTVLDFLSAVHLQHTDLAGWSMGGWVAARVAIDHPTLVDRLALYDSAGIDFNPPYPGSIFIPTDSASLTRLLALLSPHPAVLPDFAARAALRHNATISRSISRLVTSMETRTGILDPDLARITQPTLIVWGDHDVLLPPSQGETMYQSIPNASFVLIAGCGHMAPSECAAPVTTATLNFLHAQPPPPRSQITLPNTP